MQLVSFINSIIPICTRTRVTIYNCIWRTSLAVIPLANPFFTYLAPSSCDRNRPLQSQVACKLTPFVPHWPPVPSLPKSQPLLDFPGLNVHPIRATSQTQPLVYSTRSFLGFIFLVLEMQNSWKEIHISKMNFKNPELNFKIEIRKKKTRDIHNSI